MPGRATPADGARLYDNFVRLWKLRGRFKEGTRSNACWVYASILATLPGKIGSRITILEKPSRPFGGKGASIPPIGQSASWKTPYGESAALPASITKRWQTCWT